MNDGEAKTPETIVSTPSGPGQSQGRGTPGSPAGLAELISAVRGVERRSTPWLTTVLVGVGSLGVFVALGLAVWNVRLLAMLVAVLLIHEAGHFVAMRAYGYRNVQMFFIPLLGAGVSGRHFQIAAWKKAVVYLAGPLPGILISLPMIVLAMRSGRDWLLELGALGLVLNVLNLLPLLPLDGGRIVHLTVLSRSPALELAARVFAIAVMVALGGWLGDYVLLLIAVPLAISLPMNVRISRLVGGLRESAIAVPNGDEIPASAIELIDERMRNSSLASAPLRHRAVVVLQAYEAVVSRPPGLGASLAIGAVYVASLMVAIGGGATVLMSRSPRETVMFDPSFLDTVSHRIPFDGTSIKAHVGTRPLGRGELAVVAFDDAEQRLEALAKLLPEDLAGYSHARLGNVWIASIPGRPPTASVGDGFMVTDPATTWLRPLVEHLQKKGLPTDAPALHVIGGWLDESLTIGCLGPDAEKTREIAEGTFQIAQVSADRLPVPAWSPVGPRGVVAQPGQANYPFAAHVSGFVVALKGAWECGLFDDDTTDAPERGDDEAAEDLATGSRRLQIHVHRAIDRAATLPPLVAFLSERGFTDFEFEFTTMKPSGSHRSDVP